MLLRTTKSVSKRDPNSKNPQVVLPLLSTAWLQSSTFMLSYTHNNADVKNPDFARCLKITEKVSFNIASEASYVYFLSGQKLIKYAKKR